MINRHLGLFSHALLTGMMLLGVPVATVHAQAAPAAPAAAVPADLDQFKAGSAPEGPIKAWIAEQANMMANGDAAAAAQARDRIVAQVMPSAKATPGPSFLSVYAGGLDSNIGLALKSKSYEVRLNAAIAVARVAERTEDAQLANATIALLNDESPFVALWGVKAARPVLAAMLRNPVANPSNLIAGIQKAVTAHGQGPIGGAIVTEAYDAFSIGLFDSAAKNKPQAAALTKMIVPMQQLLTHRVGLYKAGIPPEPLADQKATGFLAFGAVWNLHKPAEKLTTMQQMSDLVVLAAQQAQAASPGDRESLGKLAGLVASAIAVVPETQPIAQQLEVARKVDERTPAPQILQALNGIPTALKSIKDFAKLNPPPTATTGGGGGDTGAAPAGTQPSAATSTSPAASAPATP